jgi:spore coat polysaccharide biosynthesis predicted glycosyltransferase SpsG/RimJ/RimL family protein N-acetyltransferase
LALAQRWRDLGGEVSLLTGACPEPLRERYRQEGCEIVELTSAGGTDADRQQTARALRAIGPAWTVLDGYAWDTAYQRALQEAGHRLMVLDDFGHCDRWAADVVLNQNLLPIPPHHPPRDQDHPLRSLVGPRYALLRREFLNQPRRDRAAAGQPRSKLFVTFGGSDPVDATTRVMQQLVGWTKRRLEIEVAIGAANPRASRLRQIGADGLHAITWKENIKAMPPRYDWADGLIGAAGSSCWEWMFFGLPAFVTPIAANQQAIYDELIRRRWATGFPDAERLDTPAAGAALEAFLEGHEPQGAEGPNPIDGWGAARVASALSGWPWLRPATTDDCRLYFDWANEPAVRQHSVRSETIRWEDHQRWFADRLASPEAFLWVGFDAADQPVGQVRFELTPEGTLDIGFSVDPSLRGQGKGRQLLRLALHTMRQQTSRPIVAKVKRDNLASRRLFETLPFDPVAGPDPELVYFAMSTS